MGNYSLEDLCRIAYGFVNFVCFMLSSWVTFYLSRIEILKSVEDVAEYSSWKDVWSCYNSITYRSIRCC